jgi:hypothetical protein
VGVPKARPQGRGLKTPLTFEAAPSTDTLASKQYDLSLSPERLEPCVRLTE